MAYVYYPEFVCGILEFYTVLLRRDRERDRAKPIGIKTKYKTLTHKNTEGKNENNQKLTQPKS